MSDSKTTKVLDWDMDWCFHCDHPCARCPICSTNDCACGCTNPTEDGKELPCQSWWDSMHGKEWNIARAMYFRPSRDELVEYIKYLESMDESYKSFVGIPTKIIEHARWHGVQIGFQLENDTWKIWLISVPDKEPRNNIRTQEKAEQHIQWKKTRAGEL